MRIFFAIGWRLTIAWLHITDKDVWKWTLRKSLPMIIPMLLSMWLLK